MGMKGGARAIIFITYLNYTELNECITNWGCLSLKFKTKGNRAKAIPFRDVRVAGGEFPFKPNPLGLITKTFFKKNYRLRNYPICWFVLLV